MSEWPTIRPVTGSGYTATLPLTIYLLAIGLIASYARYVGTRSPAMIAR
jgi:hypothetical protein